jgi:splicing factor 3A subunit 3
MTKHTPMSELPPSVFAGAKGKAKGKRKREAAASTNATASGNAEADDQKSKDKELALLEFQIVRFSDLLHRVVEQTKIQIEKKQTRTMEELEAELEAEAGPQDGDSDSDDEEKAIYNPKNLPLGWDGKPIPYWLYKLHGKAHRLSPFLMFGLVHEKGD